MNKKFKEIWYSLMRDYNYGEGETVEYADVLKAVEDLHYPMLTMQEVSDLEKEAKIEIEW